MDRNKEGMEIHQGEMDKARANKEGMKERKRERQMKKKE
jgi:hypothetical protein